MNQAIGYFAIGFAAGFFVAIIYSILAEKHGNGGSDGHA